MIRMQSADSWINSILFLTVIIFFLHLLHQALISGNLLIQPENVRLKKQPELPVRFRSDGTFKVLQVADLHYGNGIGTRCRDMLASEFEYCSDINSTQFLKRVIEAEKPDFLAFTGDNIFGSSATDAAESLFGAFAPAIESRLPWAAVLGNHDQESSMNREELIYFISLMDYSLAQTYPSVETTSGHAKQQYVTDIDGFGNYNLRVWGPPGSHLANKSVLNLYFLDSGDRATFNGMQTYGWIKETQLHWLHSVPKTFQEQNHNGSQFGDDSSCATIVPALAFFHIPIPEIRQVPFREVVGQYQEYVACSLVNSGVLETLVSMGDVKAVFIGHDHTNDFCGNLDGIWFCYGGGVGYHGYGKAGWPRRARIILAELGKGEKAWMGIERIKSWKRLDDKKLSKIDEQVLWEQSSSR